MDSFEVVRVSACEPAGEAPIRVCIVAESRFYCEALAIGLACEAGVNVVGSAPNVRALIGKLQTLRPDIVLLDVTPPDSDEAIRTLVDQPIPVKVVAVGVAEAEADIIMCAEAGSSGYVARSSSLGELVTTARAVAAGELPCSPRIAAALLRRVTALARETPGNLEVDRLTPRELEVMDLVDQGLSNKEIGRRLTIEVATVKNHVHHILDKLHAHRRGEAAALIRVQLHSRLEN